MFECGLLRRGGGGVCLDIVHPVHPLATPLLVTSNGLSVGYKCGLSYGECFSENQTTVLLIRKLSAWTDNRFLG